MGLINICRLLFSTFFLPAINLGNITILTEKCLGMPGIKLRADGCRITYVNNCVMQLPTHSWLLYAAIANLYKLLLLLRPLVRLIWGSDLDTIGSDETWALWDLYFIHQMRPELNPSRFFFRSIFDPRSIPAKCAYTDFRSNRFTSFVSFSEFASKCFGVGVGVGVGVGMRWNFFSWIQIGIVRKMNFRFWKRVASEKSVTLRRRNVAVVLGENPNDAESTFRLLESTSY